MAVADECCDGRVVAVTEGGYHLKGIADSLRAVIAALEHNGAPDNTRPAIENIPTETSAPRGDATISAVKPYLTPYWTL